VTGRRLFWIVLPLAVAALVAQTVRARDLLAANLVLRQVERSSVAAARQAGARAAPVFEANVRLLQRAERLAPADSRLPLARGSQYLLLGRPRAAIAAYQDALAVGPRSEIHLNLGRAQLMAGDAAAARESFRRAVVLNPRLRDQVPEAMRPGRGPAAR
jgi:tetratricopeptide (TPR) repeat protein